MDSGDPQNHSLEAESSAVFQKDYSAPASPENSAPSGSERKKKISAIFLCVFLFLAVFSSGYLIYFFFKHNAWSGDWEYRQKMTIENKGKSLKNYPFSFDLDTSSLIDAEKLDKECSSLRAVDPDSGKDLAVSLVGKCDSVRTGFSVLIPDLPSGKKDVYIYYDGREGEEREPADESAFDIFDANGMGDSGLNNQRKCARLASGDIYCVFHKGAPPEIYLFKSGDNGKTWTEERVSDGKGVWQVFPALAVDSEENLHIVWGEYGEETDATWHVYYREKSGSGWGGIKELYSFSGKAYPMFFPSIVLDKENNVHTAFQGEGESLFYRGEENGRWKDVEKISLSAGYPLLLADSENRIYVFYQKGEAIDSGYYISLENRGGAFKIKSDGRWGEEKEISSSKLVSAAIDGQDSIHLVYEASEDGLSFSSAVYYQKLAGSELGRREKIGATSSYGEEVAMPSVGLDKKGNIYVLYGYEDGIWERDKIDGKWNKARQLFEEGNHPNIVWQADPGENNFSSSVPSGGFAAVYLIYDQSYETDIDKRMEIEWKNVKFYSSPQVFYGDPGEQSFKLGKEEKRAAD